MRSVSDNYNTGADENIRSLDVKITTDNDTVFTSGDIISINIQRSITDGSAGIGYTQSDRLNFTAVANSKMPRLTRCAVYVKFDNSGFEQLGRFYSDECTRDGSVITVTAYDAMYYQSKKKVKFVAVPGRELEALSFPCLMQDVLDYVCKLRNFTCDFQCQPFTVQTLPQKEDGSFYTVRELLGFIAASHGCNVKLDANNHLIFKPFEEISYTVASSDVIDITIDDSEPYEVTGVLFSVDSDTSIYIDDVPGSEYDEDDEGVISCYNPLATVEIAEYVWSQIGGLSYYGGSLMQRGKGIIEVGDVLTVGNLKYPADTSTYRLCVTNISYSISTGGGFTETLGSEVAKGGSQMSSSSSSAPSSGSGTGKFLDAAKTSVAHNDLEHNTSEGIYDSVNGYKNTVTGIGSISNDSVSGGVNTVFGQHNTVISSTASFVFGSGNRLNANGGHNTVGGSGNNVSGAFNTVLGAGNQVGNVGMSLIHGAGIVADGLNSSALFGQGHYISGSSSDDHILVTGRGAYAEIPASSTKIGLLFIAAYNGNKVTIDTSGNVQAAGTYGTMGADYAEYFEWEDGNPDSEDRRGMLVSVRGDKIVLADGDDISGIVSASPSVSGNAAELYWDGKYRKDVFGCIVKDENGEPVLSDDYEPERKYIPRSRRKEWAAVGLVGRLIVRDDGSCKVGGYVSAKNGIAVRSDFRTGIKVLRRTDETHVEVLIR